MSRLKAAEQLGVSERTARRPRVPVDEALRVEELYRGRYEGFTVKHFHEHLVRDHGFRWGYTWTKAYLQTAV